MTRKENKKKGMKRVFIVGVLRRGVGKKNQGNCWTKIEVVCFFYLSDISEFCHNQFICFLHHCRLTINDTLLMCGDQCSSKLRYTDANFTKVLHLPEAQGAHRAVRCHECERRRIVII